MGKVLTNGKVTLGCIQRESIGLETSSWLSASGSVFGKILINIFIKSLSRKKSKYVKCFLLTQSWGVLSMQEED